MKKTKFLTISVIYTLFLLTIKLLNYSPVFYRRTIHSSGINLIPLNTATEYLTHLGNYNTSILIKIFLSLFIFVPLAIYLGIIIRDKSKNFNICIYLFSMITFFSVLVRILNIGYFDIDMLIVRILISILTFISTQKIFNNKKISI